MVLPKSKKFSDSKPAMNEHGELIRIDARNLSTTDLLAKCLEIMNEGNRATFLCEPRMGVTVINRVRIRLSRLRTAMELKGLPRQHFRLASRVFSYTNRQGQRSDCVVFARIKTREHLIVESIERTLKDADTGRNVGGQESQISLPIESRGPTW